MTFGSEEIEQAGASQAVLDLNKGFDHWVTKLNASKMVKALLRLEDRRKRQALCN